MSYQGDWRIQARRGGKVVREFKPVGENNALTAFHLLAEANAEVKPYDNIELQFRDDGASRYRPILQAVGTNIINWGHP